jgi:hypothetical protein
MAEERYAAGQLEQALALYEEIHDFGEVARPFRLQVRQRIRQIHRQQERAIGRPIYLRLQALAGEDPALAREKFQIFRADFPIHGDPDDLEHALYPDLHLVDHLLARLSNPEVDARERLAIGDELAASNDPRPGVGLRDDRLPDISWAKIPAGEFIFHFDQRMELPTFYISRYPITYRQFQAFIMDGGFEDDAWWKGMSIRDGDPGDLRWPVANYPRVRVSWFDAVAFTRWLSGRLGYEVRLPTEQEWEKAARGTIGTIYPWGDSYISGYSNINEVISGISPINLRQPTAVGVFPHAASNYGAHDMIGNVWEWCLNHFDDPLVTTVEGEDKRSMRGGAWSSDRLFAHTARRRGELPWTRFNDIGFRIACDQLPSLDARLADRE